MSLRPDVLIRLEVTLALALTLFLYETRFPHHWLFFFALILAPDLSLLPYSGRNLRLAASLYNTAHTLVLPGALALLGLVTVRPLAVQLALIWAAHIFFDRAFGYGLKFPEAFKPTHIQSAARFPG